MSINECTTEPRPVDEAPSRERGRWWAAGRIALKTLAVSAAVAAVAAAGITGAVDSVYPEREGEASAAAAVAAQEHDPAKPTAVIVLSPEGTNIADSLVPYEVLAATGAFNVYTVAEEPDPVPLTGGLDLVPDLTFDQFDERSDSTADVIVVPQLRDSAEPSSEPIVEWLRRQRADGDPLLVAVCVGAAVLAAGGMLDDRPATSHWLGLIGLRRDYPSVDWQEGTRYVDDGDIVTTAGVLSGVDGTLRAVERLVGAEAAERAARAVHWPDYVPGVASETERSRPAPADLVGLLSAGYRFDRPTMGVLLTEGVGEIALASAFRPYTELSYLARPLAVTADGGPIESRHGLVFVPRGDLDSAAPKLDRLVVPGADAARAAEDLDLPEGLAPDFLHQEPGFAFDGALRDIADFYDVATARWVAKSLEYRTPEDLAGPAWPWGLILRPVSIALTAAALIALASRLTRRRSTAGTP
ncbi:helix-turn-helix domain-containing protein [Glycomyces tarimensis]